MVLHEAEENKEITQTEPSDDVDMKGDTKEETDSHMADSGDRPHTVQEITAELAKTLQVRALSLGCFNRRLALFPTCNSVSTGV